MLHAGNGQDAQVLLQTILGEAQQCLQKLLEGAQGAPSPIEQFREHSEPNIPVENARTRAAHASHAQAGML